MFIFGVVLSTIFASYTGTFRVIEETESSAGIYGMARIALERMREDLESVYMPKKEKHSMPEKGGIYPTPFFGEDKEIEGIDADTLSFVSRGHVVFDGEDENFGLAALTYYVRENDRGEGLILYRSDTPVIEEMPEKGTGGLVLCDGLSLVNLLYHDAGGKAHDSWDSTGEEFKNRLPAMVSIMLEFINPADPEMPFRFMTGVALPMARGK